ncbi:MAG: adenylate kinase [Pseudomonadota bacterium]
MDRPARIHVFGASGSGTTTLGAALSAQLGIAHLDVDSFYWKQTEPPFKVKNLPAERLRMIAEATHGIDEWVLSGSIVSWGGSLIEKFTLAIFVELDAAIRMERLRRREVGRYGPRIDPGGDMRQAHLEFMAWARRYDDATGGVRCRAIHQEWMSTLPCKRITVDSVQTVDEIVAAAIQSGTLAQASSPMT